MTIPFVGTGGLFTRVGLKGGILNATNTWRGTTIRGKVDTYSDEYDDEKELISGLYPNYDALVSGMQGFLQQDRNEIVGVLNKMVNDDNPQPTYDVPDSIREVIRQMAAGGDTVNASSVSVAVTAGSSNTGNGKLVATLSRAADVKLGENSAFCENCFAEDVEAVCISDSFDSGATAGQEGFRLAGEYAQPDVLMHDWPRGSASSLDIAVTEPDLDAQEFGQLLTNGSFEDFTAGAPDNWTVVTGTAAGTINSTATAYRGSKALLFTGTGGGENTELRQTFDDATGTTSVILPQRVYIAHIWARKSAGLAAGVVRFALTDTAGTPLTDDLGNECSFTIGHGGLTTSYQAFSGVFVTPRVLPSVIKLAIKVTTSLTDTETIMMDDLCLVLPQNPLYTGGPRFAMFPGSTPFALGDTFRVAVANTAGGFVRLLDRYYGTRDLDLYLPSDTGGTETISDALIT